MAGNRLGRAAGRLPPGIRRTGTTRGPHSDSDAKQGRMLFGGRMD